MPDALTDFATLFSFLWYRDFPTHPLHRDSSGRADWTIHLGVVTRGCADLMGLYASFESGNRTDARLLAWDDDARNLREVASVEWEWEQPKSAKFNEAAKLLKRAKKKPAPDFLALFVYSSSKELSSDRARIAKMWNTTCPLLLITVEYEPLKKFGRAFGKLHFHRITNGTTFTVREPQPALPYEAPGRRWLQDLATT